MQITIDLDTLNSYQRDQFREIAKTYRHGIKCEHRKNLCIVSGVNKEIIITFLDLYDIPYTLEEGE